MLFTQFLNGWWPWLQITTVSPFPAESIWTSLFSFLHNPGCWNFLTIPKFSYSSCTGLFYLLPEWSSSCLNDYFFCKRNKSLFLPIFSCQFLIIFSFLEGRYQKFCKLFAYNLSKEICTFLVILDYTSGCYKFCNIFAYLALSRAFQKCIFFGHFYFANIFFHNITGFCRRN